VSTVGPLEVSRVGLGCNNFGGRIGAEDVRAVVDAALDAGINFFDTADVYGRFGDLPSAGVGQSERLLGAALEGRRDEAVVATKFGFDLGDGYEGARGSRDYVHSALAASLERLGTDRVDLLYYHFPDGTTPLSETLAAMSELVEQGVVRAIGCSNLDVTQLRDAVAFTREEGSAPLAALQNQYSLLERGAEAEVLPLCAELGVAFIPYFPLASGLLTGKYRRGQPPPAGSRLETREEVRSDAALERVEKLIEFADERGHTVLELAIAGVAAQPAVASVIAGATSPEQVRANAAAGEWELSAEDLEALAATG
jgi:aryl-alcohol dehydrogenase-like predicted oxidoreductase